LTDVARLSEVLADRYAIEREVGRGGMATVYLGQDRKHGRRLAIKVLRPELAAAVGPERFLREIEIVAQLNHPHILPLHDSGEAAGLLYYVMPYVEGETLRQRLDREKQLPVAEAVRIACEVADGLSHAHGRGVIHRDIKPENILMSGGHAVIGDFGIARAIAAAGGEKLTQTGLAMGTPTYMSPEQALGEGQLDGRSDLYSLACVLYEMLVGEPPHAGPTAQAIIARRVSGAVPSVHEARETVPPALDAVVCLARVVDHDGTVETLGQIADPLVDLAQSLLAVDVVAVLRAVAVARSPRHGRDDRRPLHLPQAGEFVLQTAEPGRCDVVPCFVSHGSLPTCARAAGEHTGPGRCRFCRVPFV
jgi:serine/threonine-protein kinase